MREDFRHAWRALRARPLMTAVVVGSLAVGIGVNTVVFSWVQVLVLQPLPGVRSAAEIHLVEPVTESGARPGGSWPEYEDLRESLRGTADLAAFRMSLFTVGDAPENERVTGLLVSPNYFDLLGLRPAAGRLPAEAEMSLAAAGDLVVVSHDFWRTKLGGTASAIGSSLVVNGRALTVAGVTPEAFQGTIIGLQFDLFVPAVRAPLLLPGSTELDSRAARGYYILARLPAESAMARIQVGVDRTMRDLATGFPETNEAVRAEVKSFWQGSFGPIRMFQQALGVLQGVLVLLLLAVCGNTANLLLARAVSRRREMGVRLSLGAGRWRVARLVLAECLVMAALGAAVGIVLAWWGASVMRSVPIIATSFPVRFQAGLDGVTLAFAALLAVVCAVTCALAPALHLARLDPVRALRETGGTRRFRAARALMAAETALALVVLLVAGVFARSFTDTRDEDPGFRAAGVLLAAYDLDDRRTRDEAREFAGALLDRLRAQPGVRTAAIAQSVPLDIHGLPQRSFVLEGRAPQSGARDRAHSNVVTPGYFETMGIGIVEGSDFAPVADRTAAPQAVVNEAFVRRFLPGLAVLGRRLESGGDTYTIAGVVRNSVADMFGEPESATIYFSYRDRPSSWGEIHLRTGEGQEEAMAPVVRRVVRDLDAALPVSNVRTLTAHVETNLLLRRIPARLFVVLGPLLLALAAVGMYAVVAGAVAQRRREMGVRLALGAAPVRVVRDLVGDHMRPIAAGAVAGWLIVYGVYIHLAQGAPRPLSVFAGIPIALLLVAAWACWMPARRAGGEDPVAVLRAE